MYFSGFLNKQLLFYELFCIGPSTLRKCALMAMRGLNTLLQKASTADDSEFRGGVLTITLKTFQDNNSGCGLNEACQEF